MLPLIYLRRIRICCQDTLFLHILWPTHILPGNTSLINGMYLYIDVRTLSCVLPLVWTDEMAAGVCSLYDDNIGSCMGCGWGAI
jgi:hypothetical protein